MRLVAVRLLTAVSLVVALAICVRAWVGPLYVGRLHMASPMGLESVFATALLILVALQSRPDGPVGGKAAPASLLPLWAALGLVAAVFLPGLRDPFLSDDYILVSHATLDPARVLAVFHTPGGDGSFRPLGYLYFALLRQFGGVASWKWHLCALLVHLVNCALLYLIVRRPAFVAFTAAVLFGLNGTRPEAVAWTAGNFDLLACAGVLACVLAVLRGRVALAMVFLVLGILCKESAYAAPFVIFGFAASGGRLRERQIRVGLGASLAVCAAMFAYRWNLFHGPGGYLDPSTGQPQVFSFHLGTALKALFLRVWANLLLPVNWDASRSSAMLGVAILLSCGALLYAACTGRVFRRVVFPMAALTIGAILPAYHLALIGDNLNGSRILYLPAAGLCVLCAYVVQGRRLAAAALMLAAAGMLLHNLDAWHRNAVLADQVCAGVSSQAPVHDLNGVVFFANGYRECVEMKRGQ